MDELEDARREVGGHVADVGAELASTIAAHLPNIYEFKSIRRE
jgi:hypothetical protein